MDENRRRQWLHKKIEIWKDDLVKKEGMRNGLLKLWDGKKENVCLRRRKLSKIQKKEAGGGDQYRANQNKTGCYVSMPVPCCCHGISLNGLDFSLLVASWNLHLERRTDSGELRGIKRKLVACDYSLVATYVTISKLRGALAGKCFGHAVYC